VPHLAAYHWAFLAAAAVALVAAVLALTVPEPPRRSTHDRTLEPRAADHVG
jgi:hypothetical protein